MTHLKIGKDIRQRNRRFHQFLQNYTLMKPFPLEGQYHFAEVVVLAFQLDRF
jgi:hypothetical protein